MDLRAGARLGVGGLTVVFICLLLSPLAQSASEVDYNIEATELTVYRDGMIHVTQLLVVNETLPAISVQLLTPLAENVVVVDENQTVLEYTTEGSDMTIFSLGARSVTAEYDTVALTAKDAGVWTLLLQTPYDLRVNLPLESTIVYLSEMPTSIDTEDGIIALSLYPAAWEISYVLPILGPAVFKVSDLTIHPTEVEVGNEVAIVVVVTNIGDGEGIYAATLQINQVEVDTEMVSLAPGAATTVEFRVTYAEAGTYDVEIGGLGDEFKVLSPPLIPSLLYPLMGIAAALIVGGWLVWRRRAPSAEKILKKHLSLRPEDKAVIRFLAEKGGHAFESEIRDKFPDLPRTSLWRLVRRLQRMDIVSVDKIGRQNQIRLKK